MEAGILIITGIILAIVIVPLVLMKTSKRKKEKQLFKQLEAVAVKNMHHITDYNTYGNFAIGWDERSKHIYFYKKASDIEVVHNIDLTKIRDCKIVKQTRRVRNAKGTYEVLEKVALSFAPFTGGAAKCIELFDADESLQLSGELEIAEKWKGLVGNLLNEKSIKSAHTKVSAAS